VCSLIKFGKFGGTEVEFQKFPNGETKFDAKKMNTSGSGIHRVTLKYENDQDLVKLMLVKNYLDDMEIECELLITYMPYSRMDRSEKGFAFTLKYITRMINGMNFKRVSVIEPHSEVTLALLDKATAVYPSIDLLPEVMNRIGFDQAKDYLFFPDAGAQKRYKDVLGYKQMVGFKNRYFETGEILSLEIVGDKPEGCFKALIVDDLTSYGGTFMFSAKKLRELGATEVYLLVTHCEYSVFDPENSKIIGNEEHHGYIQKVFTTDSILNKSLDPKVEIIPLHSLGL
jgi:ribose-phosphate pyrophosphokinase